MIKHIQQLSEEVIANLTATERLVIALLYADQLSVAEVSEMLALPPERVVAIAAFVHHRVRQAITGGMRSRAIVLWDEGTATRPHPDAAYHVSRELRRLSDRSAAVRRPTHRQMHRHAR